MRAPLPLMLGTVLLVAACGSSGDTPIVWEADGDPIRIAQDACTEEVSVLMRLRGYPRRPGPETPQYEYRQIMFARCMGRKGYVPE